MSECLIKGSQEELKRDYLFYEVERSGGYPSAGDLFYECPICLNWLSSRPYESAGCDCGRLFIDWDMFRFVVRDHSKEPRLLRLVPKAPPKR